MLKAVITDSDFGESESEEKKLFDISRYGARGIILNKDNMVGMILMKANGLYKLPGGGIELGEKESDAFVREVLEETGCECKIIAPLGTVEEHKEKTGYAQFSYVFIGRVENEHQEAASFSHERFLDITLTWMSLNDAASVVGKALDMCKEYKMKFMLLREKVILDYALEMIEKGEIKID